MRSWVAAWPAAEPVDPTKASSGFLGFVVFFLLAVAIWFIGRNLTGRLRRMNLAQAEWEAQQTAARDAAAEGAAAGEAPAGGATVADRSAVAEERVREALARHPQDAGGQPTAHPRSADAADPAQGPEPR